MSVYRRDYIIFGWKLPYDMKYEVDGEDIDFDSEDFETLDPMYRLISDGMCGSYRVFGKLIAVSPSDDEGWDFLELKPVVKDKKKLISEYVRLFQCIIPPDEPKLMIFTHWS